MAVRRGLSEVIGFLVLLIILLIALIPLGFLLLSQPTAQVQSATNANSYKSLAVQQYTDFQPVYFSPSGLAVAPVYFIYDNGYAYFVLPSNQNPPVDLVIKAIEVFNGSTWVTQPVNVQVALSNASTKFYGYPAIKIELKTRPYEGQANYVAAITQYGNIIYASPPYVLPLPKLSGVAGIVSIDPYNFSIIEKPQFSLITLPNESVPLTEFIRLVNGNYSNALTFLGESLTGENGSSFYYEGYWFGPIMYTAQSSGSLAIAPSFEGNVSGIFDGANFTFLSGNKGYFSGFLGSSNGKPIWFTSGYANYASFENAFVIGKLSANDFSGSIVIPGELLNSPLVSITGNPNDLNITIKGKGEGQITFVNVSGTVTISGTYKGIINGQPVNGKGTETFSGPINGTLTFSGSISATLSPASVNTSFGTQYLNGYIYANISSSHLQIISNGVTSSLLNTIEAAPIINGTLTDVSFTNVIATSVQSSLFAFELFNVTLNDYVGEFTLSDDHAVGTFVGTLIFPEPSQLSLFPTTAASVFSGFINGTFSGGYNYELGYFLSNPVTLSVIKSNASLTYTFSITPNYYYEYITPLVFKLQVAVANPSNTTLEFAKVQATMKASGVIQVFRPSSGVSQYSVTLYGSAEDNLIKPITVKPLSVSNFTLILTIPVNSIISPLLSSLSSNSYETMYQNLESFNVNYIELYLIFVEPNGYGVAISAIIPPYYIPTTGQVISE